MKNKVKITLKIITCFIVTILSIIMISKSVEGTDIELGRKSILSIVGNIKGGYFKTAEPYGDNWSVFSINSTKPVHPSNTVSEVLDIDFKTDYFAMKMKKKNGEIVEGSYKYDDSSKALAWIAQQGGTNDFSFAQQGDVVNINQAKWNQYATWYWAWQFLESDTHYNLKTNEPINFQEQTGLDSDHRLTSSEEYRLFNEVELGNGNNKEAYDNLHNAIDEIGDTTEVDLNKLENAEIEITDTYASTRNKAIEIGPVMLNYPGEIKQEDDLGLYVGENQEEATEDKRFEVEYYIRKDSVNFERVELNDEKVKDSPLYIIVDVKNENNKKLLEENPDSKLQIVFKKKVSNQITDNGPKIKFLKNENDCQDQAIFLPGEMKEEIKVANLSFDNTVGKVNSTGELSASADIINTQTTSNKEGEEDQRIHILKDGFENESTIPHEGSSTALAFWDSAGQKQPQSPRPAGQPTDITQWAGSMSWYFDAAHCEVLRLPPEVNKAEFLECCHDVHYKLQHDYEDLKRYGMSCTFRPIDEDARLGYVTDSCSYFVEYCLQEYNARHAGSGLTLGNASGTHSPGWGWANSVLSVNTVGWSRVGDIPGGVQPGDIVSFCVGFKHLAIVASVSGSTEGWTETVKNGEVKNLGDTQFIIKNVDTGGFLTRNGVDGSHDVVAGPIEQVDENTARSTDRFLFRTSKNDCGLCVHQVPYGTYDVIEVKPPPGYQLSDPVSLRVGIPNQDTGSLQEVKFNNVGKPATEITINKYAVDKDGNKDTSSQLVGAQFTIFKRGPTEGPNSAYYNWWVGAERSGEPGGYEYNNWISQNPKETGDQRGLFTIEDNTGIKIHNLPPGDYTVKEVTAPDGYAVAETEGYFSINDNPRDVAVIPQEGDESSNPITHLRSNYSIQFDFFDQEDKEKIILRKYEGKISADGTDVEADTGKPLLGGAKFTITYHNPATGQDEFLVAGEAETSGDAKVYKISGDDYVPVGNVDTENESAMSKFLFVTDEGKEIQLKGESEGGLKEGKYTAEEVEAPTNYWKIKSVTADFTIPDDYGSHYDFINVPDGPTDTNKLKIYKYQESPIIGPVGSAEETENQSKRVQVLLPGAKYVVWFYPDTRQKGEVMVFWARKGYPTLDKVKEEFEGSYVTVDGEGKAVYDSEHKVQGYDYNLKFDEFSEEFKRRSFLPEASVEDLEDFIIEPKQGSGILEINDAYPGVYCIKEVEAPHLKEGETGTGETGMDGATDRNLAGKGDKDEETVGDFEIDEGQPAQVRVYLDEQEASSAGLVKDTDGKLLTRAAVLDETATGLHINKYKYNPVLDYDSASDEEKFKEKEETKVTIQLKEVDKHTTGEKGISGFCEGRFLDPNQLEGDYKSEEGARVRVGEKAKAYRDITAERAAEECAFELSPEDNGIYLTHIIPGTYVIREVDGKNSLKRVEINYDNDYGKFENKDVYDEDSTTNDKSIDDLIDDGVEVSTRKKEWHHPVVNLWNGKDENGRIVLTKVDKDYPDVTLPGAKFTLQYKNPSDSKYNDYKGRYVTIPEDESQKEKYRVKAKKIDSWYVTEEAEITTNEKGKIDIEGLLPGEYELVETEAPDYNYNISGDEKKTVTVESTLDSEEENEGEQVTFENEIDKDCELELEKRDKETNEIVNKNIEVMITYKFPGPDGKPNPNGITLYLDSSGNYSEGRATVSFSGTKQFSNLRAGYYIIEELTPPDGYSLDPAGYTSELVKDTKSEKIIIYNEKIETPTFTPTPTPPTELTPITATPPDDAEYRIHKIIKDSPTGKGLEYFRFNIEEKRIDQENYDDITNPTSHSAGTRNCSSDHSHVSKEEAHTESYVEDHWYSDYYKGTGSGGHSFNTNNGRCSVAEQYHYEQQGVDEEGNPNMVKIHDWWYCSQHPSVTDIGGVDEVGRELYTHIDHWNSGVAEFNAAVAHANSCHAARRKAIDDNTITTRTGPHEVVTDQNGYADITFLSKADKELDGHGKYTITEKSVGYNPYFDVDPTQLSCTSWMNVTKEDKRLRVDVEGLIWDDTPGDKKSGVAGGNSGDHKWNGEPLMYPIEVNLYRSNGELLGNAVTTDGRYSIRVYMPSSFSSMKQYLSGAYVEFTYNGLKYQSVYEPVLKIDDTGSKALETEKSRREFNELLQTIISNYGQDSKNMPKNAGNNFDINFGANSDYKRKILYEGQVDGKFSGESADPIANGHYTLGTPKVKHKEMDAKTQQEWVYEPQKDNPFADNVFEFSKRFDTIPKYQITATTKPGDGYNYAGFDQYNVDDDIISNVNLGLFEREQPDISLANDIVQARISINDATYIYKYGSKTEDPNSSNLFTGTDSIGVRFQSNINYKYKREVYPSDVQIIPNNDPANKKLQIHVRYRTIIKNESTKLIMVPNEIVSHYDARYTDVTDVTEEMTRGTGETPAQPLRSSMDQCIE